MPHRASLATVILAAICGCGPPALVVPASAYVNYDLPPDTHRAMLRKMTSSIHDVPVGSLTQQSLQSLPDLMSAWSQASSVPFHQRSARRGGANKKNTKDTLDNIKEAEGLLRRVIDERHAGNPNAELTTGAYNAIIEGWANAAANANTDMAKAAAHRAEEILIQMQRSSMSMAGDFGRDFSIEPNTETFRLVLLAWGNVARSSKESADKIFAAHRAWDTLAWMVRQYKSDENTYAHAKPDANCFESVMATWAQSGHTLAAERVEELLYILDRLYQAESGNDDVDGVDNAFNDSVLRPNTRNFDQVLSALAQKAETSPEAAKRAENILNHMEVLADQGVENAGPSLASFCAVSGAWAKVGGLEGSQRADDILRRVEQHFLRGEDSFQPDCLAYNIVTDSFVKARSEDSYKLARKVLDRQIEMHTKHSAQRCKPDVFSFSLVLNGCASAYGSRKERLKAFQVAKLTLNEMESFGVKPNQVTYGIMLKCANKLLQPGSEKRESFVRDIFERSRRDGLIDSAVVNSLRLAASSQLFNELLGKYDRPTSIPPEWSCNVNKKKPRRAEV